MHICIVNPFYDSVPRTHLEETGRYRHVGNLAAALARRGHQITVVQAFHEDRTEQRGEVKFVYSQAPYGSAARLSGGSIGVDLLCRRNLERVLSAVAAAWPDAVHMNGITLQQPLAALSQWCGVTRRRLTVSHHGG